MTSGTRKLALAAIVGALYAALTMLFSAISFTPLQLRLSEALCVLPFFAPVTAWGLFAGCAVANLLSPVGMLDMVFGPVATLLAALCTAALGRRMRERGGRLDVRSAAFGCAMPVLFNGVIIGAILAYYYMPEAFLNGLLLFGAQVAMGEAIVLFALGLPLMPVFGAMFRKLGYLESRT